jgi:hypothetical protein
LARGPAVQTTQLAMAARNIEIGTLMKSEDLTIGPWTGVLPKGAQATKEPLIGRGVIAQIYQPVEGPRRPRSAPAPAKVAPPTIVVRGPLVIEVINGA